MKYIFTVKRNKVTSARHGHIRHVFLIYGINPFCFRNLKVVYLNPKCCIVIHVFIHLHVEYSEQNIHTHTTSSHCVRNWRKLPRKCHWSNCKYNCRFCLDDISKKKAEIYQKSTFSKHSVFTDQFINKHTRSWIIKHMLTYMCARYFESDNCQIQVFTWFIFSPLLQIISGLHPFQSDQI